MADTIQRSACVPGRIRGFCLWLGLEVGWGVVTEIAKYHRRKAGKARMVRDMGARVPVDLRYPVLLLPTPRTQGSLWI